MTATGHRTTSGTMPTSARRPTPLRHVAAFACLAYALTWVAWIPANLAERGTLDLPVPALLLVIVGGFGPLLAAVLVTGHTHGRAGLRRLVTQLDPRRAPARWFAACLVLLPLNLAPVAFHVLSGGTPPTAETVGQALLTFPFLVVFVALVGGGLDEEVGWRGYALPALLGRWRPLVSHVALGVVWALWHLPMWLDPASAHAAYPVWLYVLKTVGLSVVIGWLYASSGGNLAVAIVAHAVSNGADGVRYQLLPDRGVDLGAQVTLTVTLVLAATVIAAATRGRLGADRLDR